MLFKRTEQTKHGLIRKMMMMMMMMMMIISIKLKVLKTNPKLPT
jgi:hypothetical protein